MVRKGWFLIGKFNMSSGERGTWYRQITTHTKKEIDSEKGKMRYKLQKEHPLRTISWEFYTKYF